MPSVHFIAVHVDVMQTHLHLSSYKKKRNLQESSLHSCIFCVSGFWGEFRKGEEFHIWVHKEHNGRGPRGSRCLERRRI